MVIIVAGMVVWAVIVGALLLFFHSAPRTDDDDLPYDARRAALDDPGYDTYLAEQARRAQHPDTYGVWQ